MPIMSKLTAAYLAGLIDGEGYLGIIKRKHKECIGGISYYGVIKVGMTDKEIIEWLYKSFGGNFEKKNRSVENIKWKDSYIWSLKGVEKLNPFIEKIFPYLRVKKNQAETLKKFLKSFKSSSYNIVENKLARNGTGYHKELKKEIREYRIKLYKNIRTLNKKGKPLQPERLINATPQGDVIV